MPASFCVTGGRALKGTIRPAGNKNAALPILAATLLADGPCRIDNVPHIRDVETMLALLEHLGAAVRWEGPNVVEVDATRAEPRALDPKLCARIRASILLAGPMLARFGNVNLPPPGGDVIGRRRVDTHFLALEKLGAEITVGDAYKLEGKLTGADIFLDEPSVTGTENALMAAVLARGTTVLRNAASEPHVQDLARFLVSLGAAIDGIGSNTLTIEGGRPLKAAPHTVGPDHIEIGSFIGLAAVTGGAITIDGVRGDDLRSPLLAFARPHVHRDRGGDAVRRVAARLREAVRVAIVLRGQTDRHGRADRLVRSPSRRDRRSVRAPGAASRESRYSRRHGDAARRARRAGRLGDSEYRTDRARLRAHRRAVAGAGSADREARRCAVIVR